MSKRQERDVLERPTRIRRVAHERNYTVIANCVFDDARMSMKSRGLLCYLLSRPDDWDVNVDHLASVHSDGSYAIRTTLADLEELGYVTRERENVDDAGHWRHVFTVSEDPTRIAEVAKRTPPESRKSRRDNRDAEIAIVVSTDRTSTERTSSSPDGDDSKPKDALSRKAHELAKLAFEQPVKPVIARMPNPFVAVLGMVERELRSGRSVQDIQRAIEAGVDVWTTNGLRTSIAQRRSTRRAGVEAGDDAARRFLESRSSKGA